MECTSVGSVNIKRERHRAQRLPKLKYVSFLATSK